MMMQGEINLRKAIIALDEKSTGRKQFNITVHGIHTYICCSRIIFTYMYIHTYMHTYIHASM